jgi:hypothetical protein
MLSKLAGLVAVVFVALAAAGPHPVRAQGAPPPMTALEKADLRHMLALNPSGRFKPLDFSDDAQYRFYLAQVQRAGITPERAPRFYRALAEAREQHKAFGPPKIEHAPADVPSGEVQTINLITELGPVDHDAENWASAALSSVPDGSTASRMTLVLYDQDFNPIGPSGESSDYDDGKNLGVQTTGHIAGPSPAPHPRTVQAVETFFYQKNGKPFHGYATRLTATYPEAINNLAPVISVQGHNFIKVCLDRQQFNDCDYYMNTTIQNVQFPVQGNASYYGTIQLPITTQNAFSYIEVTRPASGGGCPLIDESAFFQNDNTHITGGTISWFLNPASFGSGATCYTNGDLITFTFSMQVTVLPDNSQNGAPVWIFITNAPDTEPNLNTLVIPPMQLVYGCLAEDTLITMQDGKEVKIQNVVERNKVLQSSEGRVLTVEDTTVGFERKPMVRIRDSAGHSLLLTEGHPVVTARGVRLAGELAAGDEVVTRDGKAILVSVGREEYGRKVWNLNVGMPVDGVKLTKSNTTFFANGILVGDGRMQATYGELAKRDPRALLERLPAEWHEDYFNDLKTHGRAIR